MEIPIYIVDAFTSDAFGGNPAAVCLLQQDVDDELKQKIATEMNLSETAFVLSQDDGSFGHGSTFGLRWFTPTKEVPLCGHATLASAFVLFNVKNNLNALTFETMQSGSLTARRIDDDDGTKVEMLLPLNPPNEAISHSSPDDDCIWQLVEAVLKGTGLTVVDVRLSSTAKKLLIRVADGQAGIVETDLDPNQHAMTAVDTAGRVRGVIVTAKADDDDDDCHFKSRYFSPWNGIPEDPVTGSAHTVLAPYWKEKLEGSLIGGQVLKAIQVSKRGGTLWLSVDEKQNNVKVWGDGKLVLKGTLKV